MKQIGKIALVLGVVAGAGLSMIDSIELQAQPETQMQLWQQTDSQGNLDPNGASFSAANRAEAQEAFECFGEVTPCAAEVDAVNGNIIGDYIYLTE